MLYLHIGRIFAPVLVLLLIFFAFLYRAETQSVDTVVRYDDQNTLKLARRTVSTALESLSADALFLAGLANLRQWVESPDPTVKRNLIADMRDFMLRYARYDQVRYIDAHGMEVIRIDNHGGQPFVIPEPDLQNKSDRYYVQAVQILLPNQIYISPFDLNVEHGRIEEPYKPMIRVGTPIYDNSDHYRGSILLNYLGNTVLANLRALRRDDGRQFWLLNRDGYWLLGPSPLQEWGFMWKERRHNQFQNQYPDIWQQMSAGLQQDQIADQEGLFSYQRLDGDQFPSGTEGKTWYLVAYTPASYIAAKKASTAQNLGMLLAVVTGLLLLVCWRLAHKELARQRIEDQVKESESRYRSLLENAPDSIVIVDQGGFIRMINAEAEKAFGFARNELLGKPVEALLPERFRVNHVEYRNRYLADPVVRPMGASSELFVRCRNGCELPVEISLSPLQRQDELWVTAIVRNISARKEHDANVRELNRSLTARTRELEAINAELEAFSYSVSHDLRAPLRAMDGFSQTLLKEYRDQLDQRGRDRLERIRAAAQRMAQLIDDLLKLSRISRTELKLEPVDLSRMAQEILADLQQSEPQRSVDTLVQEDLQTHGDPHLLSVVLTNLLANAWKFTARTEQPRIEVSAWWQEEEHVFAVRDNGAGFNMEYAGKLFGAFQRLHDAAEFPGTGIGLATVQRVINKHGGRVWAESVVGHGATFFFTVKQEQQEHG